MPMCYSGLSSETVQALLKYVLLLRIRSARWLIKLHSKPRSAARRQPPVEAEARSRWLVCESAFVCYC